MDENVLESLDSKMTGKRNAGNTGFVINCDLVVIYIYIYIYHTFILKKT